jgi:uncharacterized membrane protein (DUF485 family)
MTTPIISTLPLDEQDVSTVRQLYSEAQNWSRHYEQLIVNANVFIVSASLIFVGLAFGDKVIPAQAVGLMAIPMAMALIGIALTTTLFNLYAGCIKRMIRLENLLGCFCSAKLETVDGLGPLLPIDLMKLPVEMPASARFFIGLYVLLALSYVGIAGLKWL